MWMPCVAGGLAVALCACAELNLAGRIYNGQPFPIEKHPFIVYVKTELQQIPEGNAVTVSGTGVILSELWVATAGHILGSTPYSAQNRILLSALFVAGITTLTDSTSGIYNSAQVFVHPNFQTDQFYQYDIGIMKADRYIVFSLKVMPIPLATVYDIIPNSVVDVCGWGNSDDDEIRFNSKGNAILLEGKMRVLDQESCRYMNLLGGFQPPGELNICILASDPYANRGDSGGPVIYNNRLLGLVASGQIGYPTFVTSIPHMRAFITSVTGIL